MPKTRVLAENHESAEIRSAIAPVLSELRESLHRRGRLSSRNEALDELSKLLFAHISSLDDGSSGINRQTVFGDGQAGSPAASLAVFVAAAFRKHLPESLSHEMTASDFQIKIKPDENALAVEIVECFERLASRMRLSSLANIRGTDILNDAFGTFLASSFLNEKELSQYLTPTEVVEFMAHLALRSISQAELEILCDPERCPEFGLILDPSCGVASFPRQIVKLLYGQVAARHGQDGAQRWLESIVRHVLVGIDKSERMVRLALTNMAMLGVPAARLHLANSLALSGADAALTDSLAGRVRLILTNPPFGAEFNGLDLHGYQIAGALASGSSAKVNSELLFLERYVSWLTPGGHFIAIVPDSVLTNSRTYQALRQQLSSTVTIRTVVSLPREAFGAAGTSIRTSILHAQKLFHSRSDSGPAYVAECKGLGYRIRTRGAQRAKIVSGTNDLPRILEELSVCSPARIGRWVEGVEKFKRWDAKYHASLPLEVEQQLNGLASSSIHLSDVARLATRQTDPRKYAVPTFEYIEISDVDPRTCLVSTQTVACSDAPNRARQLVRARDVLFARVRPEGRLVGVVTPGQDGAVCTTGFAVLHPEGISPLLLAYLLKSDFVTAQILRHMTGIAYTTVDETDLLDIVLPVSRDDLDVLEPGAEAVLAMEFQIADVRADLSTQILKSIANWTDRSAE